MSNKRAMLMRPLKLYATGHLALLVGAWAMSETGSMVPMALAASACLMLTGATGAPLPQADVRAPLIAAVAPLV
jgi:hypothetical protein